MMCRRSPVPNFPRVCDRFTFLENRALGEQT